MTQTKINIIKYSILQWLSNFMQHVVLIKDQVRKCVLGYSYKNINFVLHLSQTALTQRGSIRVLQYLKIMNLAFAATHSTNMATVFVATCQQK